MGDDAIPPDTMLSDMGMEQAPLQHRPLIERQPPLTQYTHIDGMSRVALYPDGPIGFRAGTKTASHRALAALVSDRWHVSAREKKMRSSPDASSR